MKICPDCRDEFLDHIVTCPSCQQPLVDEASIGPAKKQHHILSKEDWQAAQTVVFVEAGLSQCREVEQILAKNNLASLVYPMDMKPDGDVSTLGASREMKYGVLLRVEDLDAARQALEGQFLELVSKEGRGHIQTEVVNLDNEVVTCPCCGETDALQEGACKSCGLMLGVIEG